MRIGVVSKYPAPGRKHSEDGGVVGYTKNLVTEFKGAEVTVYANRLDGVRCEYMEDGVRVRRVWKKGAFYPLQLIRAIADDRPSMLHLQHEFFLYGGAASSVVFPFLLAGLKLLGIPSVVTVHGVVPIGKIDRDFVRQNGFRLAPSVVRAGFYILTKGIYRLTDTVVVHEERFRDRLVKDYRCDRKRCEVIPHGIEQKGDLIERQEAMKTLGIDAGRKVVLFFGYLTEYKGLELLIDAFRIVADRDGEATLIIAGGRHPRLKDDPAYIKYLEDLRRRASAAPDGRIVFTDFVPDEMIGTYFSAADLVVFPYKSGISSSGPMAFAFSYGRPFIFSDVFRDHFRDFDEAVFRRDPEDLARKILDALNSEVLRKRLSGKSVELKEERSWKRVAEKTMNLYRRIAGECGVQAGGEPAGAGAHPDV